MVFFPVSDITVFERRGGSTGEGADANVTGSDFFFFNQAEEIKGLSLRMYGSILAMKKYFQSPQHQKYRKGR